MQVLTAFKELNTQDAFPSEEHLFSMPKLFYRSVHCPIRFKFQALGSKKNAFEELLKVPCVLAEQMESRSL